MMHTAFGLVIGCSAAAAIGLGTLEVYFQRNKTFPVKVRAAGFSGIIRETIKVSLVGSGAGWLAGVLSDEFDNYPGTRLALLAALIISLFASLVGFYMSAMADVKSDPTDHSITISSKMWFFIRGMVLGLCLSVLISLFIIVVAFAVNFTGG